MPFASIPLETSARGSKGSAMFIQDQTTPVLTIPMLNTRTAITLAATAAVNQNIIVLEPGHGVTVGEIVELAKANESNFMQASAVVVATDTITLDSPLNTEYVPADTALASSSNMLVDGSSTPVIFSILPLPTQAGDMVRIILELNGGANQVMDFSKFGSDAALTKGVVVRINNGDGTYRNLFNFKRNGDFIRQGFDHGFLEPKTGNTITGFVSRVTWGGQNKHGVVIRLDGSLGESLEIVVQDALDATNNTLFFIGAQGHELQE